MEKLRLIEGGRRHRYWLNDICCRLVVPGAFSRQDLDALVFEEDTRLVLTVEPTITYREEHPIRLMTEILHDHPHQPGSLVMNNGSWYGVVIDLEQEPVCQRDWIVQVYQRIGEQVKRRGLQRIGIHLLGTMHGKRPVNECLAVFVVAVQAWRCSSLREIWLVVDGRSMTEVRRRLSGG